MEFNAAALDIIADVRRQRRAARLYRDRAPQFDRHRTHATERDSITAEAGWLIAAGMLVMTALYVVGFVS